MKVGAIVGMEVAVTVGMEVAATVGMIVVGTADAVVSFCIYCKFCISACFKQCSLILHNLLL